MRVSAHVYNEAADYAVLADAVCGLRQPTPEPEVITILS